METEKIEKRKISVLISEDTDTDVILMVRELRRAGFDPEWKRVQTASEFRAALTNAVDIILADYRQPNFTALDALKLLQESKLDVPLIVVTGLMGDEAATECIKRGALDYVLKDRMTRLGHAVTLAIEERKFRRERQLTEAALRASEQRYRTLVDNAPTGIFINLEGKFAYVNSAFCGIVGATSPEQLLGMRVLERIHPDCHAAVLRRREHIATTGESVPLMDQRYLRLDGSIVEVETTATPAIFQGQSGWQVAVNDVTQRREAEEAARRAHQSFRSIFDNAVEGLYQSLPEGKYLMVNPAMARMFGYASTEEMVREVTDIARQVYFNREERAAFQKQLHQSGVIGKYESRARRKDGSIIWISQSARVIYDSQGVPVRYEGCVEDITERRRADLQLTIFSKLGFHLNSARTVREAAEIIVESADKLFGWDACSFHLYSAEKKWMHRVLNKDTIDGNRVDCPFASQNIKPTPRYQFTIEHGAQLVNAANPVTGLPEGVPFGDVARKSQSLMFVPVRDHLEVTGLLSIQSYTPNAYTEEDLNALQALADHTAGALNRIQAEEERQQLEEQFRQAQKMEAIGQLAGGVAHDFNNLLTVITGYSNLLLEERLQPAIAEQIKEISTAAGRASNLTRQLLTFSRKQKISLQSINLNQVIGDLSKMLTRMIGEDMYLDSRFAPRLPEIQADIGMMEQLLMNLAVNARDAMPHGGTLFISTDRVTIDETYARSHSEARAGEFVSLRVRDTGSGISPDVLPHIFEPFFTTKEQGKGTGLGLATVYGIAKQHLGWIEVTSQLNAGTTFTTYFPVSKQAISASTGNVGECKASAGSETILLVDDDAGVRNLARRVLRDLGYNVIEAESGRTALKFWEENRPEVDLLLTDLVMPDGVTGHDLAQRLQKQKSNLKVIYSSGYRRGIGGADFESEEGRNFLPKPYDPGTLAQVVRECLDSVS